MKIIWFCILAGNGWKLFWLIWLVKGFWTVTCRQAFIHYLCTEIWNWIWKFIIEFRPQIQQAAHSKHTEGYTNSVTFLIYTLYFQLNGLYKMFSYTLYRKRRYIVIISLISDAPCQWRGPWAWLSSISGTGSRPPYRGNFHSPHEWHVHPRPVLYWLPSII